MMPSCPFVFGSGPAPVKRYILQIFCSQGYRHSQPLTAVKSWIHMEHIVVVMSRGNCPAAYRARNVEDHMVETAASLLLTLMSAALTDT